MKVLLVEDEPGIREGMCELIAEQATVVAPERVEGALKALEQDRFELVLTDLAMEGDRQAGFRILERARARLLPTALVTGSSLDLEGSPRSPFRLQGLLSKPFSLDTALELLERFVGLGRALSEAARRGPEGASPTVEWGLLRDGQALAAVEKGLGFGFQVVEGTLRFPGGTCGPGARGFVARGERQEIVAEGAVRLVTLPVEEA